jgi:hypothetical protein
MTNFVTNPGSGGSTFASDGIASVEHPLTKVEWGDAGTANQTSLTNPFPIQPAATSFIFSANGVNSSNVQLASGATFTGTVESIQSQQTISILLVTDQPGTLHIIQYIDAAGTQKVSDWTESIVANVPYSEAYTANGNYFKATFTNTGGSTTTTFNLNVAYGTLPAVSSLGNGLVSLNEVNGTAFNLGQQAMGVSLPVVIANNQSAIPVSDSMVLTTYTNAAAITLNTILATIDCSTDAAVSIQCTSMGTSGAVTPEWSNDNTNWVAATGFVTQAGVPIATVTAAGLWTSSVYARYLRLRMSTASSAGTTTFSVQAISQPVGALQAQTVVQPTAANLLCTATISGSPTINTITTMPALVAGTAAIGDVGIQYRANATGAASITSVLSPATPAGASIKASAGRLLGYQLVNSSAAIRSVKLYNATAVTMGTTAAVFEIDLAAGQRADMNLPGGIGFATGIMWSVTGAKGLTDNTTTGLAANDVSGAFFYA